MAYLGEPDDVEGECNAHLHIGDDQADNHSTMRCQREPGHGGYHRTRFKNDGSVEIRWERDEKGQAGCDIYTKQVLDEIINTEQGA